LTLTHAFRLGTALLLLWSLPAAAQLTDATQSRPGVPGGAIARSLEGQVGAGHGDEFTPGSAVYLIKRDPARSIRRGRQLFQRKFTAEQGFGPRVSADSAGDIQASPAFGAGLVDSCAGCHGRPRGSAGFGGDVVTRPDSRDAPHLFGLGLQEMLADEMTRELRAQRDGAVAAAQRSRRSVTRRLLAKGIDFGSVTASPSGGVDVSRVRGVDPDLRLRPFFHHGGTISIREFVMGAFKDEMGLEASDPVLCAVTDPVAPSKQTSPSGFVFDPALDDFQRPPSCDSSADRDGDGVANEIDPALVDHMEFYLLNYFKPGLARQTRRTREGLALLGAIRCTECHVQSLTIASDRRVADVATVHDPNRGIMNRLFATASTRFEAIDDGDRYPLLLPAGDAFVVENIFTDFRRHDLGPGFHERNYDGTRRTEFLTEALWGVGSSPPYGHDGRSISLEEVILRHGGEARRSREAFARLGDDDQRKILEFLETLVLFPPDDTASNLNPGRPGLDPQDPANHGSINLGALFQIADEGAE
jgi:hypothetical protein